MQTHTLEAEMLFTHTRLGTFVRLRQAIVVRFSKSLAGLHAIHIAISTSEYAQVRVDTEWSAINFHPH